MAVMATSAGSSAEGFGSATGVYQSARPRLDSAIVRLESIIQYSLDKFQFRNALFLAERLLSQVRGYSHSELEREHARYLLATCHYRQGKPEMAWAVLEGSTSVKNRFLFAQCCLDLRRYVEGAGMLEWLLEEGSLPKHSSTDILTNRISSSAQEPDMASVLNLLGHTVRAQQRHKLAISYFKQALELNPFLWEAYECLCELGDLQDPNTLFTSFNQRTTSSQQRPPLQRSRTSVLDGPLSTVSQSVTTQGENVESASADPFSVTSSAHLRYDTRQKTDYFSSMLGNNTALSFQQNDPRLMGYEGVERIAVPLSSTSAWNHGSSLNTTIDATERVTLKRGKKKPERSKSAFNLRPTGSGTGISKRGPERSASIANFAASGMNARMQLRQASILGTKKDTAINEDRDLFRDTATSPLPVMSSEADPSAGKGELEILMDVFRVSARSYALLSLNRYSDAMTELEALPHEHLQSGWAQCQLGKCKFGLVDYTSAIRYFGHARELEPGLQQDMELYSTCLWHMRKETMLSTLAKELKDANLHSPQAWVALGNAFSLRRETEQALKCFHRAIQLNDRFAYAHTLSGHEYSDLEEYDKAQTAFRRAMSIDPRHYQAWFGLGVIYDKMGKYDLALIHYKEAHNLNRSSGVLLYRVGQCQEKLSRVTEALRSFEDVIRIDSSNVAARYSKARIQTDMGQYEQALQELEVIKKLAPDEPNAFLLQGKVLQKMGDKAQALKYLTYALNLDSKSSHTIRDIIEKLELDADYEEESYEVKIDADL